MTQDREDRENKKPDRDDQELWEQELEPGPEDPDDEADEAAASANVEPQVGSGPDSSSGDPADTTAEWFVDFEVWLAALEAKFGPEFEQVLTRELGPDWVNKLNKRMMDEKNFLKVLDDVKENIAGQGQGQDQGQGQGLGHGRGSGGGFVELGPNEDRIGFEALGQGEVIYDESMVGPGGGAGGESREKELPNLSDLRKKDFDAAGGLKSPLEEQLDRGIIEEKVIAPDEKVVLMDRNDFSRLSYFARKELDRHKGDLETRKVLERKSKELERQPIGALNRLILVVLVLVLLYAVFCLFALPVGEYRQDKLAAANPADYLFRPSTEMRKQGELSRVGDPVTGHGGGVISFYFLQPSLKRLELDHVLGGERRRFSLDSYSGRELRIDNGPWGDTLEVRRFYSRNWPTNRSALLRVPYLSLSRNGRAVLLAFERRSSGLLPGLLALDIVGADGSGGVGLAYAADNLLHIKLAGKVKQGSAAEADLTLQFVFLFSLVEL